MSRVDSAPPPQANPPVRRAPEGRGPRVPGPLEVATLFWRWLRRMRSALYLLGVLGLLTLIATVVPQEPNVPATVARWRAGTAGPGTVVSGLIDAIGGYDVYGSAVFVVVLGLLFTSLTACLIPRYRAWWRLVRRSRPPRNGHLDDQPSVVRFTTEAEPEVAHQVAAEVLRRHRWRLRARDGAEGQVAAERGHVLREGGSLLFHTAFYVLLIAIIAGQLLGFSGQVGIVEGDRWAETAVGYWSYHPGRWWDASDHRGFVLGLDAFEVDWYRDVRLGGQPKTFLSHVTIEEPDGTTFQDTVGGNDPLVVDGMKIHQLDWGYAPRVVVVADGDVVFDEFLTLNPTDLGAWKGAVKAPGADPDVGLEISFWPYAPDHGDGPVPTGAPWADAPLLQLTAYRGDVQLDRVQNVNDLDTSRMDEVAATWIRPGEFVELPGDVAVLFPELRRWVGFQVSRRPTIPYLLLGAGLVLLGLLPALYAYRRRVWVQAVSEGPTTQVTVAGRSFQRPQAFEREFDRLADELRHRLTGPPTRDDDPSAPTTTEVVRG